MDLRVDSTTHRPDIAWICAETSGVSVPAGEQPSLQAALAVNGYSNRVLATIENLRTCVAADRTAAITQAWPQSAGPARRDFDHLWTPVDRPFALLDLKALQAVLERAPSARQLLGILEKHGKATVSVKMQMMQFASRRGVAELAEVCTLLAQYYGNAPDKDEAATLVADALRDIAMPSTVDQQTKGTCTAAAFQMQLASDNPVRYVRMLTALALGHECVLEGGEKLRPNPSWRKDPADRRSLSCKIFQDAIMQLGNGHYDSLKDADEGMTEDRIRQVGRALFGGDFQVDGLRDLAGLLPGQPDRLVEYMEDELARGRSVVVTFYGHAVAVVGLDKSTTPVTVILDSWGRQYAMSIDDFKACINAVFNIDDRGLDNHKLPAGKRSVRSGH